MPLNPGRQTSINTRPIGEPALGALPSSPRAAKASSAVAASDTSPNPPRPEVCLTQSAELRCVVDYQYVHCSSLLFVQGTAKPGGRNRRRPTVCAKIVSQRRILNPAPRIEPRFGSWNRQGAKRANRNSMSSLTGCSPESGRYLALQSPETFCALGGSSALFRLNGVWRPIRCRRGSCAKPPQKSETKARNVPVRGLRSHSQRGRIGAIAHSDSPTP